MELKQLFTELAALNIELRIRPDNEYRWFVLTAIDEKERRRRFKATNEFVIYTADGVLLNTIKEFIDAFKEANTGTTPTSFHTMD